MQFINKTVFLTAKNKLPFKISTKLVFFYRFSICFINKDGLSKITSVLVKTFLLFSPEKKKLSCFYFFSYCGTFRVELSESHLNFVLPFFSMFSIFAQNQSQYLIYFYSLFCTSDYIVFIRL